MDENSGTSSSVSADAQCFKCKGLTPLIEMAKEAGYRGPKIILCGRHMQEVFDKIDKLLAPKPFKWRFWRK